MNKTKEEILQQLSQPHCLSLYSTDWGEHQNGCLFYANDRLTILDTPWRKDDCEIVAQMHKCELEMFNNADSYICEGDCARMIGIIISGMNENKEHLPVEDDELIDYFEKIDQGKFLREWLKLLKSGIYNSKNLLHYSHHLQYFAAEISLIPIQLPYVKEGSNTFIRVSIEDGVREPVLCCYTPYVGYYSNTISVHKIYAMDTWTSEEKEDEREPVSENQIFGFSAFIATKALLRDEVRTMQDWEWDGFSTANEQCCYVDGIYQSFSNPRYIEKLIRDKVYTRGWFTEEDLRITLPYYCKMSLDANKHDLFEEYFNYIIPLWQQVSEKNALFPEEFSTNPKLLYSLMLWAEQTMFKFSMQSQLWNSLHSSEQQVLSQYANRYMDYLRKEKGAHELLISDFMVQEKITPLDLIPSLPCVEPKWLQKAKKELEEIGLPEEPEPHWPYFTNKASEEDKHGFEIYLKKLCKSKNKYMTADIKDYLDRKKKEGLITRPQIIKTEFEVIKKFGYPHKDKAYYRG